MKKVRLSTNDITRSRGCWYPIWSSTKGFFPQRPIISRLPMWMSVSLYFLSIFLLILLMLKLEENLFSSSNNLTMVFFFPLYEFFRSIFKFYKVSSRILTLNSILFINAFETMCWEWGFAPSIGLFHTFFKLFKANNEFLNGLVWLYSSAIRIL